MVRFKGKDSLPLPLWFRSGCSKLKSGKKAWRKMPDESKETGSCRQTVDPEGLDEKKKNTLVTAALIQSDMSHSLVMKGSTIPKCCRAASLCCFRVAGSNEWMGVIYVDTMRTTSPRDGAPR